LLGQFRGSLIGDLIALGYRAHLSWLHNHRRLARRYDPRADIHEAFLTIGCALICHQHLTRHANSY